MHGIQILDGGQACKSGSARQNAQYIVISLNFKSLIAFFFSPLSFFNCPGFVTFPDMRWQKVLSEFMSGGHLIVAIFKKEKRKKSRLKTYSSVNKCDSVVTDDCVKQQICLHILLHHSRCALQVNIVQKIQVSVGFVKSSCIDRPFDLISLL